MFENGRYVDSHVTLKSMALTIRKSIDGVSFCLALLFEKRE